MKNSVVIGVDPGLDGAVAALSLDGRDADVLAMPTIKITVARKNRRLIDCRALCDWLRTKVGVLLVAYEEVHATPVLRNKSSVVQAAGSVSNFTFGRVFGQVEGVLAALSLPCESVTPQKWKKVVLEGTAKDKEAAIVFATRRWGPDILKKTPRCTTPADGIADALAIAEYARRMYSSPLERP